MINFFFLLHFFYIVEIEISTNRCCSNYPKQLGGKWEGGWKRFSIFDSALSLFIISETIPQNISSLGLLSQELHTLNVRSP